MFTSEEEFSKKFLEALQKSFKQTKNIVKCVSESEIGKSSLKKIKKDSKILGAED
jgi:hypothetical protein